MMSCAERQISQANVERKKVRVYEIESTTRELLRDFVLDYEVLKSINERFKL